jgi:hypothetical protein
VFLSFRLIAIFEFLYVVAIRFTLATIPKIDPAADPDQTAIDQYMDDTGSELWESVLCDDNNVCAFTRE